MRRLIINKAGSQTGSAALNKVRLPNKGKIRCLILTFLLASGVWSPQALIGGRSHEGIAFASPQPATVTLGPYLQLGTPTSVIIRWQTNSPTDGRVRIGTAPESLVINPTGTTATTNHEIRVTGLLPNTAYYYSVGTPSETLAGGSADYSFVTSPETGSSKLTRIWVLGDSGTKDSKARRVRDSYYLLSAQERKPTDLWLMLGDNAYGDGTEEEYREAVFQMYPEMLRKSVLWPTLGNHDSANREDRDRAKAYLDFFTLPTQAEAGGLISGDELYYSFDYGNIHFICLDSMISDRRPDKAMLVWLENDIRSTRQQWIIAFWHHPPYSGGSHDSDIESHLKEMRRNALPILERWGVDLVLAGHSHAYERSILLDGHYGTTDTLTSGMKKNPTKGRIDEAGPYIKRSLSNQGAVYTVAGSSGQKDPIEKDLRQKAMIIQLPELGSMILDINGNTLDARFLREKASSSSTTPGPVQDHFTIIKAVEGFGPSSPTDLTATATPGTQIRLSWRDNSQDETKFTVERSQDGKRFETVASLDPGVTSFTDTGLATNKKYFYRVRAHNARNNTASFQVASATTLQ